MNENEVMVNGHVQRYLTEDIATLTRTKCVLPPFSLATPTEEDGTAASRASLTASISFLSSLPRSGAAATATPLQTWNSHINIL